jgi:hypothetical protein
VSRDEVAAFRERIRDEGVDSPLWRAVTGRLGKTPDTLDPNGYEQRVRAKVEVNRRIAEHLVKDPQFQKGLKDLLDMRMGDDLLSPYATSPKDMLVDLIRGAINKALRQQARPASYLVEDGATVRELITSLSEGNFDPVWYEDLGDNELKGKSAEEIVTQLLVRQFVDGWAATSNDSDPRSISKQMAAGEMYGIDYEEFYKNYRHKGSKVDTSILDDARRQLEQNRDLLHALTRAEYNATQEMLREAGIKTVTVYRGVQLDPSKQTIPPTGSVVESWANPLSSWTTDLGTASGQFGRSVGVAKGVTFAMEVPVEMIQATTATGRGCLHEYEVILIGHPSEMLTLIGDWFVPDAES